MGFTLLKFYLLILVATQSWTKEDNKWVWNDNSRSAKNVPLTGRYEVFEDERPIGTFNPNPNPDYRPPSSGDYIQRPLRPDFDRPRPDLDRPRPDLDRPRPDYDRPSGGGLYNPNGPSYGESSHPGILTGPVPSWVQEGGPFKNYDRCKCTERFNCNSPGISYGHCDAGKQYCCYATKKVDQLGGPYPSRPVHSIENGILVGPGHPSNGGRPGFGIGGGGGGRPDGPIGYPGRPGGGSGGGFGAGSSRPIHSIDNGILVGPGGPYDRPGYGRNAKE